MPLSLAEEAFSFQLGGTGAIFWAEIGVVGLGQFAGTLILSDGAMPCYLYVGEDGTPIT